MARKTETITIDSDNRDNGKTFVITEMGAEQAERWAIRALLAFGKSGAENGAMASISSLLDGDKDEIFKAFMRLDFATIEPLLSEMLDCISYQMTKGAPRKLHRGIVATLKKFPHC